MELLRKVGPYLAIELFMPGGTLLALLLYFARQRKILVLPVSISGAAVRLLSMTSSSFGWTSKRDRY
jgi:hypothetical protein